MKAKRSQAEPLFEGEPWRITRADLLAFLALLLMGGAAFGLWRLFS